MYINRLKGGKIQYVAERKELEHFLDNHIRQIIIEEIPKLIRDLGKKEWLTKEELMTLTGWSGRTIQHMRDSEQIPYTQHGRKILYPRNGIIKFFEDHRIERRGDV